MTEDTVGEEALTIRAAELYYGSHLTHGQIAQRLGVSRFKVGRLLRQAREIGLVRIEITHPTARVIDVENQVLTRFGLRAAHVVHTDDSDPAATRWRVGRAAADFVSALRPSPRRLGISWGTAIAAFARALPTDWCRGVDLVQIKGGASRSTRLTWSHEALVRIARSTHGTLHELSVPAIVDQAEVRTSLERLRPIAETLAAGRRADVKMVTVGALGRECSLAQVGYLDEADIERLETAGAIGDINSRFVTIDGQIADPALDARTLGLSLEDLSSGGNTVAVVTGVAKATAITAALRSGAVDVLVTDEATAQAVLDTHSATIDTP
ncbi:sugar-binding transcriptional regulator [Haloechinothrix halophila]|uniref:sugar-binding transcriptional regulator n=1 Tax=Haloechinothrix halophila TaxID=1069073 RepID=UPI00041D7102|nr:sugar-binding transcriptional regulator [Haloechinothrix halophila]